MPSSPVIQQKNSYSQLCVRESETIYLCYPYTLHALVLNFGFNMFIEWILLGSNSVRKKLFLMYACVMVVRDG